MTIINMPLDLTEATTAEDGLVWKQIIPLDKEIVYGGKRLKFTKNILDSIKSSYDAGVLQQTAFQLVDDANRHDTKEDLDANRNFDPQRYRGDIQNITVDARGLRAGFQLTDEGKTLIKNNPKLGVSASIKPNYVDEKGQSHDFVLRHVVGTLDPKIKHMSPWETEGITLSENDDPNEEVFDLTAPVKNDEETVSKADYDALKTQLDEINNGGQALLDQILSEVDEPAPVNMSVEPEAKRDPALVALENKVAASDWRAERLQLTQDGVPASMLNLCDGVMSTADSATINLSDGNEVDPRTVIRGILNEAKGTVDLSADHGHGSSVADENEQKVEQDATDAFINKYMNPLF